MSECKHCGVDSDEYYMRDGYCLECAYSAKDSTIARLTQELEEARDNKEKYYSVWLDRCKEVTELQAENAALKAKVERLRELLYRQIEIDYTSEGDFEKYLIDNLADLVAEYRGWKE